MTSFQSLFSALGYVVGITFILHALFKLKSHIDSKQSGKEGLNVPLAYLFSGAALIYIPTIISTLAETFFGSSSVLQYTAVETYDIYHYMHVIIGTAGVIWFVRGCVLLAHASDPHSGKRGSKGIGAKGLSFVVMGICATHLDATVAALESLILTIFNMF